MKYLFSILLLILSQAAQAQLRVANIFGDHMVLQQKSEIEMWGWAGPTGEVTVKGSWDGHEVKAKVPNTAMWRVNLNTPAAGGPYTITLKSGQEELVLSDVLIGEVWLCSGQSNMEWGLAGAMDGKEEVPHAQHANIRLFQVARSSAELPQIRVEGSWKECTPESAAGFSAVGYYFGKRLQENLNVPIGLMNVSWGGTPAETWTPAQAIESDPVLKAAADKLTEVPWGPVKPGLIYNSMMNPVIPYGIAGVIWYQGEANVDIAGTYERTMAQMIKSWRAAFKKDFPFYYVQIAPFTYGDGYKGTLLREQQVKMQEIPKTGMVVISDHVEDVTDIHPKFKKPVGDRLANYALGDHYGKSGFTYKPPVYSSMKVEKRSIRIAFDNVPNGLESRGGAPTEFLIAGEDRKFYPAKAKIEGKEVVVSAKEVKAPVAVRFGWPNESVPNLFSKEGLPVSCFRTDDWPMEKP